MIKRERILSIWRDARAPIFWQLFACAMLSRGVVLAIGMWLSVADFQKYRSEGLDAMLVGLPHEGMNSKHSSALAAPSRAGIEPWYRFDACWYAEVAENGYQYTRDRYSSVAFLPLLPLLMWGSGAVGLDIYWMGIVIPNLAFVIGFACFGKLVVQMTGDLQLMWKTCLLLIMFPGAFFFSAPYQESLAFAITAGTLLFWWQRSHYLSAVSYFPAGLARLQAGAVGIALLFQWLSDLLHRRKPRNAAWLVALSGAAGVFGFLVFLYMRFGDPMLHFNAHTAWGRQSPSFAGLGRGLHELISVPMALVDFALHGTKAQCLNKDALVAIVFLALGIRAWRTRGPFWGLLILVPILQGLSTGITLSMTRIVLSSYPAFLDFAELLEHRWQFWVVAIISGVLQVFLLQHYVSWDFVA